MNLKMNCDRLSRALPFSLGLLLLLPLLCSHSATGQQLDDQSNATQQEIERFEKQIRPFLINDCYDCHSAETQEAGLRVDSARALLDGGDSGPAIVPGKPDQSLLYQSIAHQHPTLRMPEGRPQLPAAVIAEFRKWIESGAYDPRVEAESIDLAADNWDQVFQARRDANRWFAPVDRPQVPLIVGREGIDPCWSSVSGDSLLLEQLNDV